MDILDGSGKSQGILLWEKMKIFFDIPDVLSPEKA
jgi:hypothetical protein